MSGTNESSTLRLLFPQWQGGNNPPYYLGSQLLEWLAPAHSGPKEEVTVPEPDGKALEAEDGIVARSALVAQLKDAQQKIAKHQPDRIAVLGGDCLVDLAPFAYLHEKYGDDMAVLWVDAHPDIMTPEQYGHAHAMVLGCLMGHGDKDFVAAVKNPIDPKQVCYLGVNDETAWESEKIAELGIPNISPEDVVENGSENVIKWFKSTGATKF